MKIQCRTCHAIAEDAAPADETGDIMSAMARVERVFYYGGDYHIYRMPCGHGEYRGIRHTGDEPIRFESALKEGATPRWTWEWWDAMALAQEQAQREYNRTRPIC